MGFNVDDISVVIPTYNRAALLVRAVRSVLEQTRAPAEVIVVDDGSDDETKKIVNELASSSEIPVIHLYQRNQGPAAARNKGIEFASCPLIAFLDSDDYWLKKKLEIQADALENAEDFKISHTMERWYRRGEHLNQKKRHQPPHGNIFAKCLELCCVGMSTVMVRKELFAKYGLFDPELRCCEDYEYWLRTSVFEKFFLVEKRLTVKDGGRDDQVSSIYRTGMDRFRIQAIEKLLQNAQLGLEMKKAALKELKRKCMIYGNGCVKHGKDEEGHYILTIPEKYMRIQESNETN